MYRFFILFHFVCIRFVCWLIFFQLTTFYFEVYLFVFVFAQFRNGQCSKISKEKNGTNFFWFILLEKQTFHKNRDNFSICTIKLEKFNDFFFVLIKVTWQERKIKWYAKCKELEKFAFDFNLFFSHAWEQIKINFLHSTRMFIIRKSNHSVFMLQP